MKHSSRQTTWKVLIAALLLGGFAASMLADAAPKTDGAPGTSKPSTEHGAKPPALAHHKADHTGGPPGSRTECVHPYPCGDEWPAGLDGPFELKKEVFRVTVPSFDGTELAGWIALPDLPEDVRAPVLLHSSPYLGDCRFDDLSGACRRTPEHPSWFSDDVDAGAGSPVYHWGAKPIDLIREGYAMASFSVRGTGESEGCINLFGEDEQRDQAFLVEWLADQPWSNGRVAMGGISYPGTTPLAAAIRGTPSLKTIVVAGIVSDLYTYEHTPQGARQALGFKHGPYSANHLTPPLGATEHSPDFETWLERYLHVAAGRGCAIDALRRNIVGYATDSRDESFYSERRLTGHLHKVKAAVLLAEGFNDPNHWQDDLVWNALDAAPKRQLVGQWGHDFPYGDDYPLEEYRVALDPSWEHSQWKPLVIAWLDFWLKGIGVPPRLGHVDYQDTSGTWRDDSAWPPKHAKEEVIYLDGNALAPKPGAGSRTFRAVPNLLNSYKGATLIGFPLRPWSALCPDEATARTETAGVAYFSEPRRKATVVAGNPFAYLTLQSDAPGGIVTIDLVDVGPDFSCENGDQPTDVRALARGSADLRFHQGNLSGRDFPVGIPTRVRIDLNDLAARIEPGHRLAFVVSYGETHIDYSSGQPYFPTITVVGTEEVTSSHLVIPLVEGTLGGKKPRLDYPPRPFTPE